MCIRDRFIRNRPFLHIVFYFFQMWLRLMFVIRYFQIPGEICDKYYMTIFYLRIQMILEMIVLIIFVVILLTAIFLISIRCCQMFCPNVIGLHSFLIDIGNSLNAFNGEASSVAIRFVTNNIPRIKYDPNIHTNEKDCIICMEEFVRGAEIIELPCDKRHYFHAGCVMDWIEKARKVTCPICRKDMAEGLTRMQEEKRNQPKLDSVIVDA
eukprot:TRINITY_DN6126_c0_g3_i3.p1 TRINITY_DN6126_c0_g3~~TRINITY_DN6126_c0_g3_i3.p1  ORF type:complete len:210 (+),score=24.32 TRINITY_DN6126_c0_g3_i3:90-719(+)